MLEAEIAHNLAAAEVVLVELVLMLMDQMEEMEEPVVLMTSQVVHNIMLAVVEVVLIMLAMHKDMGAQVVLESEVTEVTMVSQIHLMVAVAVAMDQMV